MTGDAGQAATAGLAVPVGERDHIEGPATASVTLVEYGDYECPHCRATVGLKYQANKPGSSQAK